MFYYKVSFGKVALVLTDISGLMIAYSPHYHLSSTCSTIAKTKKKMLIDGMIIKIPLSNTEKLTNQVNIHFKFIDGKRFV
ncbi:hypothetical protein DU508_00450 [Pedobacter chinensis]|uniref:Uncharacterized protein n=1 Tax=Pedobacter chinensis TaxID=2282421 RepID=A0A369Q231_9SPHI|nr:hypothetical protein DU508_00450 [Pedobacter chinensis]